MKNFTLAAFVAGCFSILVGCGSESGKTTLAQQTAFNTVDTDLNPKIRSDFSLTGQGTEHRKMGKIKLELRDGKLYANGKEVIRYVSPNQTGNFQRGNVIEGHKLREELKGKQALNACIRDYLFEHPELIPESWKEGVTYFWGTIALWRDPMYPHSGGDLYVAYLQWRGDKWGWLWNYDKLDRLWFNEEPAALLADQP